MKLNARFLRFTYLFIASVCLLTGCTTIDGKVPGKREVLAYVDDICQEPYQLISVEQIKERPANVEYTFETEERGLRFTANSYLSNIMIDNSSTDFYYREISCDYVQAMHQLYYDRAKEALGEAEPYDQKKGWYSLLCFEDIAGAAETILKADRIYAEELAYNSPEYLQENPLMRIHFVWYESEEAAREGKNWENMMDLAVTGSRTYEDIYDTLADCYAQLCMDGKIEDRGEVPTRYLEGKHVSMLEHIYLNGEEMDYETHEDPYSGFWTTTDHYRYCWYSEDMDSYMMVSDVGYTSKYSSVPMILAEYVHGLGGSYELEPEKGISRWTIGKDTWEMEAESKDSTFRLTSLEVRKNGKKLDIPYVTVDEDTHVGATFCVGLKVEDFAKLFDLEYEIDEEGWSVYFYSEKRGL